MLNSLPLLAFDTRTGTLSCNMGHHLDVNNMGSCLSFFDCPPLSSSSPVDRYKLCVYWTCESHFLSTSAFKIMLTQQFARWEFVGILDCITEAALFGISVYLVWNIQMSMKSKTIVVCAFGCRLP